MREVVLTGRYTADGYLFVSLCEVEVNVFALTLRHCPLKHCVEGLHVAVSDSGRVIYIE